MATESATESDSDQQPSNWRAMAVERSLDPARLRAEKRVQRFLDTAVELMNADEAADFTVQEVVERSGQSLRSFYQYFAGKHELLLTLFEESVRTTTVHLQKVIEDEDDPLERLHRFVVEYHLMCRPPAKRRSGKGKPPAIMVEFAQRLLTGHPNEAALAFAPLVSLFRSVFDEAVAAGELRSGLRSDAVAGTVLQAIMFNAFAATIAGSAVGTDDAGAGEEMWQLIRSGIAAPDAGSPARRRRR